MQFVRLRFLTRFGRLTLIAAGEQSSSTVPVPVDQSLDGWADEQNINLLTLKGYIASVSTSGRVYYVDQNQSSTDTVEGYGDFDSIQAAIDAAALQSPTSTEPWVVLIRPGTYVEDLSFVGNVHVMGWPGDGSGSDLNQAVSVRSVSSNHNAILNSGESLFLSNLSFDSSLATVTPLLMQSGLGVLGIYRCSLNVTGALSNQGPALHVSGGSAQAQGSRFLVNASAGATQPSVSLTGLGSTLTVQDCDLTGPSGLSLAQDTLGSLRDVRITGAGVGVSYAVQTEASNLEVDYCTLRAPLAAYPLQVHPSAGVLNGDVSLSVRWTFVQGGLLYDITGVTGTTTLNLGSCEYTSLLFPGGVPSTMVSQVKAATLFYDNSSSGLVAANVQDALDEIKGLAVAVRTLDDAYNGGVGAGAGRTILADSGAVQIVDASSPSEPVPAGNTNGRLQIVGNVEVGSLGKPEIDLDPNPFGHGPTIKLGHLIQAGSAPFGSTATVAGQSTGAPEYNNYNLRFHTESTRYGGSVGRVVVRGGDALANGISTPVPGSVFLQAGSALGGLISGGSLYLSPGSSVGGSEGSLYIGNPTSMTPATLTAGGPFVGGVSGTIRFATNMGAISVDILAGDSFAGVQSKFDATGHVVASDVGGGVLRLTSVATGPNAEIFFLSDDQGLALDTALGVFSGVAQVNGAMTSFIRVDVTAANEVTFGAGGAAGPMVYNADTGKLTVPGLIDPTGMQFDVSPPIVTPSTKGSIFVGDGTSGTTLGHFYYQYESGAMQDVSSAVMGALSVAVEDETTPLGGFTTLNFTGSGVVATDAGSGRVNVTIAGGGGGLLAGVAQDTFNASAFTGGTPSQILLASTHDTTAALQGLVLLFRNGVADMTKVSWVPNLSNEFRINGLILEVGTNITTSGNTYTLMYPKI